MSLTREDVEAMVRQAVQAALAPPMTQPTLPLVPSNAPPATEAEPPKCPVEVGSLWRSDYSNRSEGYDYERYAEVLDVDGWPGEDATAHLLIVGGGPKRMRVKVATMMSEKYGWTLIRGPKGKGRS